MVIHSDNGNNNNNNNNNDSSDDSSDENEYTERTTALKVDQETFNLELQKAKEHDACLIIIRGTPQGHSFFVNKNEMIIGRAPEVEISIMDSSISRKHARIVRNGEKVDIYDLGSQNGTVINNVKIRPNFPVELAKEDYIKLGNTVLKFLPAGELEILFYGNLESAAYRDELTQIYNKRYLLEALEAEFKRAKALQNDFSLLFFDIDHFKPVNDTYGHDAGDFILKEFAQAIRSKHVRPKDVFARYGGEEFIMILTNTNAKEATKIAEQIRITIETFPFLYEDKRISITTSIGVAELTVGMQSAQTLLKIADKALYAAKNAGRNRVMVVT